MTAELLQRHRSERESRLRGFHELTLLPCPFSDNEAAISALVDREQELENQLDQFSLIPTSIERRFQTAARETLDSLDLEVIAAAAVKVQGIDDQRPLESPFLSELRQKLANIEEGLRRVPEMAKAAIRAVQVREVNDAIAAHLDELREDRIKTTARIARNYVQEIRRSAGSPAAWRTFGELIAENADKFPEGLGDEWERPATASLDVIDPEMIESILPFL
jgi:hypothetical protein